MKNLYILLIITFFLSCKKHKEPIQSSEPSYFTFNGDMIANDNTAIVSADDNLIICSYSSSVIKISKSGKQIWRKDFLTDYQGLTTGIAQTSNQDLFICGTTSRNSAHAGIDFLLIKTNSTGDTLWTKNYGRLKNEDEARIIATSDGNILIAGRTESSYVGAYTDFYLVKVNTNGDTLWTRSYFGQKQEISFHLMETKNGEYLVTGTNEDNGGNRGEVCLLKVNAMGEQLWNKKIGGTGREKGKSTIELANGDLVTCGEYVLDFKSQILVYKTDSLGNVIWRKEFGEENFDEEGSSIKQNADGSFIITGSSDRIGAQYDIILLKIDQNGKQVWFKKFGGNSADLGKTLIKDLNNDNIIIGVTFSYGQNAAMGNIFMIRTDSDGNFK